MATVPSRDLEIIPNPSPGRDYEVSLECAELSCLCPRTGQPDFATIRIVYTPKDFIVELKSLKLYLWSFRNEGIFHEALANRILDDLVEGLSPRRMTLGVEFNVRGGIYTTVSVSWPQEGQS